MRRSAQLFALFFPCLFHLAGHTAPTLPACSVESQTYDSKDVLCMVPHDAQPRRFDFIVRFSGSHDDTRASIQTRLDGRALQCDDGSKMELFAEDGDVSLHCRFALDGASGGDSRLQVTLRWSHAQFTDFQLADR